MSVFLDGTTRCIVQGITGREAGFWTCRMLDQGTKIVAGVTPGKGGATVEGISVPVYDTVKEAMERHQAEATVLFVPAAGNKEAVFEALDSGIRKLVLLAEGIPLQDQMEIRSYAMDVGARIFGANTAGVVTPGQAMLGFIPWWLDYVYKPGEIGVMTRSGSLTNEINSHIVRAGFGHTTCLGIGGDPVPGTRFVEALQLFETNPGTKAVVLVGEVGGTMEEEAAEAIEKGLYTKPLAAFIAGRTAPPGKRMGHAGAIVTGGKGSLQSKWEALSSVGAGLAERPSLIGEVLKDLLKE
jgi:succinyl-CoA synthetase alpha subunit